MASPHGARRTIKAMELEGGTAFVTGGASGLGLAAARHFVDAGARVFLYDLDAAALERAGEELGAAAGWHAGDVADERAVAEALDLAAGRFGDIHVNVNAAGVGGAARAVGRDGAMPLELFERSVRVNLIGTFNVLRLCAERMQRNAPRTADGERGVIVNVASIAAFDGQTGQSAYAAGKGGVVAMTLPLARDLARCGVRVVTVAPGVFDTPLLAGAPEHVRESLAAAAQFPKRLGEPDEFAREVAHIVRCGYLNGATVRLDAGVRMPA